MPALKQLTAKAIEKAIPIDVLERGKFQPRQHFNQDALQELANSIREAGILQALIVRPKPNGNYEIIAGERRWRAAQLIGLQEVPCKIVACHDEHALQIALIENLARQDLNPIEEAQGIFRLIEEFSYTQDEVAENLGKSRPKITNLLRLLELHNDVKTLILKGDLTESHGKILLSVSLERQYAYARETVAKKWSTRQLEKAITDDNNKKGSLTSKSASADVQRLQRNLSDYLGAAVRIKSTGKSKGAVLIGYNSLDELDGILERIGYHDES